MIVAAVVLMVFGIGMVSLSLWRKDRVMGAGLPSRGVRRAWLPSGLVLMTLSVLFGITYSTTLPSSPLRVAETNAGVTRNAYITMQAHTQYFQMHTATHVYGIQSTLPVWLIPTSSPNISDFGATATVLIWNATATQQATINPVTDFEATATALILNATFTREAFLTQIPSMTETQLAVNQRTLDAGDYIAATGTANAITTASATNQIPTPTPR